ncbi:hypothetical protein TFLX_02596 [Thermoflexales bacterium]|nr:hypothetical protein TFLX_02596 [Thermoflexales bacterium]
MRLQDAFDGGERRRVGAQYFAQLAPNRAEVDQARHLFGEASTGSENQLHDSHGEGARRGVGAARVAVKTLGTSLLETFSPLA